MMDRGAGGRDGGGGGVAVGAEVGLAEHGLGVGGEGSALGCELFGRAARLVAHELHDALGQIHGGLGVVSDAELEEQVGPAHDAQADLAVLADHLGDLGQRVDRGVDDVVEKANREMDDAAQLVPVNLGIVAVFALGVALAEVDGAEVAGFVGEQWLLAAGVGGFDLAQGGGGIVPIDAVEEDNARIAGLPRLLDQEVEDLACIELVQHLPGVGGHEVVLLVFLHGAHEGFGQADGEV